MNSSPESGLSEARSNSSSIIYRNERLAQFQSKVLGLARSRIWPHSDSKDKITVELLRGGGFNSITGLTFTRGQSQEQNLTSSQFRENSATETITEYILRTPRFESARVDDDTAVLLFVKRLSSIDHGLGIPEIPVPEVITFDETENNCLWSPFMVYKRLHGQPLIYVYPQLGHEQQRRVAHDLGCAYRRMLAVSSTQAGRLILPDDNKSLDAELHVTSWDQYASIFSKRERKPRPSAPYRSGRGSESVLELLTRTFEGQKAVVREKQPHDTIRPARIDQFCNMVSEMDSAGLFVEVDGHFALSHLDLEPRNILVDRDSPSDRRIISGILDWDSAILAPAFMSCTPPMWIWSWQEDDDEGKRMANDEPATSGQKELKAVFEAAAGPLYIQYAYHPAYRLARRLVRFAIYGIRSNGDDQAAKAMLEEWHRLLPQDAAIATAAKQKS